ncbi:MAG: 3-phosphoserine/phosphohydroxythreonine transaminase [Alphaproteobacteria bacterium]|nr:3-phosphoserine/phosphohydroxythreonine transaminase [Alphaproteobacteria bacterium]
MKQHALNFNSGPAVLPLEVIETSKQALQNFNDTGLSILEIGHRTEAFKALVFETQNNVKNLMNIGADYEVLFLTGGATQQFMQIPYNLLNKSDSAAYVVNGIWGEKAVQEAQIWSQIQVVSNTTNENHTKIETDFVVDKNHKYLHVTSNNTVEGTQWHQFPKTEIPLVADMSSDIFSRQLDFTKFDLIYAGAQKNLGAAGVTLVVIKKSILENNPENLSPILDYRQHIKAGAILNTPPVFAIYVLSETVKWIINNGGLNSMEQNTFEKASAIYKIIDDYKDVFHCPVRKEDRSFNNIIFNMPKELETNFLNECKAHKFIGLKGYRTKGGVRISIYNAMPLEDVKILGNFMLDFVKRYV